jgi:hypothetical protein
MSTRLSPAFAALTKAQVALNAGMPAGAVSFLPPSIFNMRVSDGIHRPHSLFDGKAPDLAYFTQPMSKAVAA